MRFRHLLIVVALLAVPTRAIAAPIGTFDWVHDVFFGTGSSFTVTNESTTTFEFVFVDLYAPGALTPFHSVSIDDVAPAGGFAQSIDDLSLWLVPDDFNRVSLRLGYSDAMTTTTLLSSALDGDPSDFLAASVVIDAAAVPEPATSLLVALGLAVGLSRRRSALKRFAAEPGVPGSPNA